MKTIFIVWNPARNEGYVTDDKADAYYCSTGDDSGCFGHSTVAETFRKSYADEGDEEFPMQTLEIDA